MLSKYILLFIWYTCIGVRHGIIVTVLLFLLSINSLSYILFHDILIFVDDANMISANSNSANWKKPLNLELQWSKDWDMPINLDNWVRTAFSQWDTSAFCISLLNVNITIDEWIRHSLPFIYISANNTSFWTAFICSVLFWVPVIRHICHNPNCSRFALGCKMIASKSYWTILMFPRQASPCY